MTPTQYHELVEALRKAESIEEVHAVCGRLTQELGFDFFLYGARFPTSFVKPTTVIISGYPEDWNPWYQDRKYERVDPIVRHCVQHITPLIWDTQHKLPNADAAAQAFMSEARDLGLRCGVSFPLHGSNGEKILLSLAVGSEGRDAQLAIGNAQPFVPSLLAHVHETLRLLLVGSAATQNIQLSVREKECLLWSAEGKTAWEISQILHISERTVVFHLQNASEKLGVVNRQQAVARAIALGVITPNPPDPVSRPQHHLSD